MERTELKVTHFNDLIDRVARFTSFSVCDRQYTPELLIPELVIDNKDLLSEISIAANRATYWGMEAAKARRYKAAVETQYRAWRETRWMECKATLLETTGKSPSDSYADKMYRQDPAYVDWNMRKENAQEAAEYAEAVYEGFRLKAELIKVAQRVMHDEVGAPYYVTEEAQSTVSRQPKL